MTPREQTDVRMNLALKAAGKYKICFTNFLPVVCKISDRMNY